MSRPADRKRLWHSRPWKWAFSLGVGMTLLAALALASAAGTLLPLDKALPVVYGAWWYQLLLLALAINLACTTHRTLAEKTLPSLRVRLRDPLGTRRSGAPSASLPYRGGAGPVAEAFRAQGFGVATEGGLGAAWKGTPGRFGSAVAHAGIVVTLASGFLSAHLSREGMVALAEGEETQEMRLGPAQEETALLGFRIRCDEFETGFFSKTRIPSKYVSHLTVALPGGATVTGQVEVNHSLAAGGWAIHQTSYEEIAGASRYVLAVRRGGAAERPVEIKLSPGQVRPVPGAAGATIALGVHAPHAWTVRSEGAAAASGVLREPAKRLALRADSFLPDFVLGDGRKPATRSNRMDNPALHVTVLENGREVGGQWLFAREDLKGMMHMPSKLPCDLDFVEATGTGPDARFAVAVREPADAGKPRVVRLALGEEAPLAAGEDAPTTASQAAAPQERDAAAAGWQVDLVSTVPAYRTVLTLTRNPALPALYTGCVLILAGLLLAFGVEHRVVRFGVDAEAGLLHVTARYRHPRGGFDRATARALRTLGLDPTALAAPPDPRTPPDGEEGSE